MFLACPWIVLVPVFLFLAGSWCRAARRARRLQAAIDRHHARAVRAYDPEDEVLWAAAGYPYICLSGTVPARPGPDGG